MSNHIPNTTCINQLHVSAIYSQISHTQNPAHRRIEYLVLRVLECIVTISFGVNLYCGCLDWFCDVWVCVCVGFVMCGCVYVWVL